MSKKRGFLILFVTIAVFIVLHSIGALSSQSKRFAVILQAGNGTHEGMARAVHALLYATELKEEGYEVVLIFDGAGTTWYDELSDPASQSPILSKYEAFKKTGVVEIVCDYCADSFKVKDRLLSRQSLLLSEYKGHPIPALLNGSGKDIS